MRYCAAAKTDVGRKRQGNEDSFCLAPEIGLFVVADGMGGHAAGEVASNLAVDTIQVSMAKYLGGSETAITGKLEPSYSRETGFLVNSIHLANRLIYDAAQTRREYVGMGTTVVAVLVRNDSVALAYVGDSRAYRIRGEAIVQLSRDHSLVQQQVDRGIISAEEAQGSQYKHLITRALGLKESVDVDVAEQSILAGDCFLLCSDGLSDLVEDEEISAIVRKHTDDLEQACQALVDRANFKGGDDNITALLIQAQSDERHHVNRLVQGTAV
ncbi:MAG TPA: Stp1/IreP family PP2C-type Ser/Thr phosphatase [Candidatus Acidoferrum sp.]|nr:Stp1/IreP family PP2C-type Ser/Thr phosphatase [Candidatus Methylomirabilis sp.]HWU37887.1 Stp1/IreP family PP2C-type Ser/Thr phosphatase [Candidatus Acidoferrum sp.]